MVLKPPHRTGRYLILTFVFFLFAVAGLHFINDLVDFPVYYHAGQSLLEGRSDLYAPDFAVNEIMDYRYPPLFLIVFIPLWLLPYPTAAYIWFLSSVLLAFGCVAWVRLSNKAEVSWQNWLIILFTVGPYYVMALHYGNAQLLITFLLFGAFYLFLRHKITGSAFLMALAVTIKPIPILVLPYFLVKKQWRFLILTLLFLLLLNLLPALFFGFPENMEILFDWVQHVTGENAAFHEIHGAINQSLRGQLQRLLTDIDYSQRYDGHNHYPQINLFSLPKDAVNVGAWIVVLLLYLLVHIYLWQTNPGIRDQSQRSNLMSGSIRVSETSNSPGLRFPVVPFECDHRSPQVRLGLEIGLVLCLILLFGPLTSKIYLIALLWPVYFLTLQIWQNSCWISISVRLLLLIAAVVNTGAPMVPSITRSSPGQWSRLLLVIGTDFYFILALFVFIWIVLFVNDRQRESSEIKPENAGIRQTRKQG